MIWRAKARRALSMGVVAVASLTFVACGSGGSGGSGDEVTSADVEDGPSTVLTCDCGETCSDLNFETSLACEEAGEVWDPGAVCGMTLCGETCGVCSEAATALCWDGACSDPEDCDIVGFTDPIACANDTYCEPGSQPYGQAATTPSTGGGFKVKYVATVDDYSLELDPLIDADALVDGRPIAKKKIFLTIDHAAYAAEGGTLVGTHELGGDEAKEGCTFCVRAGSYCNQSGCGQHYVATEGTLEIVSSGEPGTPLVAAFEDVKFTQVYLHQIKDDGTYKVAGQSAKKWCLGDFPISLSIPEPTVPVNDCVTEGTGVLLGDNIADYTLTNCLGEEITLHSRCGRTKAVWVVAVAGW